MPWTAGIFIVLSVTVVSVSCLTADRIEAEKSGWSATPNTQYHIQTDEGPERYFRFQTLNGQYRKEKRLEDGTVIGTEGWLDPLGYFRVKDYIADHKGYRILKSKTVFVGRDRPIEDALAASKRVPARSGILAKPRRPANPFRQPALQDISSNSIESNTVRPYGLYSPVSRRYRLPTTTIIPRTDYYSTTVDPLLTLPDNDYSKPTTNYLEPPYIIKSSNQVSYQLPYAIPAKSALSMKPPIFVEDTPQRSRFPAVPVTPESNYGLYRHDRRPTPITVAPFAPANSYNATGRGQYRGSTTYYVSGDRSISGSPVRKSADSNPSTSRNVVTPNRSRSPAYAQDRSDVRTAQQADDTREYDFPPYDGHHTSADGFQYYLKTHYHEEEKDVASDKSVGSFGYVDPFGIRRVVYYKSDPQNGFIHKKNNRFVGFNATPYDPLPIGSQ